MRLDEGPRWVQIVDGKLWQKRNDARLGASFQKLVVLD